VDIGNEKRGDSFQVSIGIIRNRAGVSRRTVFDALAVLESLRMVSHTQNKQPSEDEDKKSKRKRKKVLFSANTWTIYPSAPDARGNTRTRGSAKDEAVSAHIGSNNCQRQIIEEKKAPALPDIALDGHVSAGAKNEPEFVE
jgi:hypothetical protein